MTRDDIIRMAQESGMAEVLSNYDGEYGHDNSKETAGFLELVRFASLVAAEKEQQMIREGYRKCAEGQRTTQFCGLLDAAVKAEREACAKVAESYEPRCEVCPSGVSNAIRARGEQEQPR